MTGEPCWDDCNESAPHAVATFNASLDAALCDDLAVSSVVDEADVDSTVGVAGVVAALELVDVAAKFVVD